MCGFAGIVTWDNRHRVHRDVLEKMSARIAHRGPDGQGLWINHEAEATPDRPQVGLVHRRLAIIDLDVRANQPFTDGRGRWLVFNGEIYNYRELRKELETLLPDYAWHTQSDTEVLLASYAAWGERCVDHLNGMFAFAIWDEPKGELFLARDRMGQKPLYYACVGVDGGPINLMDAQHNIPVPPPPPIRWLAFASEPGAIRAAGVADLSVDASGLTEYLQYGFAGGCIYRGLRQLPPATVSVCSGSTCGSARYWPGEDPEAWPRRAPSSDRLATERTRNLVDQAVRRQLVADVPLGCFLSGGIDSSVVAAAMKTAAGPGQPVHTFSIGFDDPRYDESRFAREVAEHLGTVHHAFTVRPHAAHDLPGLAAAFGEPFGDSSALPTHYLARETRNHVKVAISGDGGDELFGGYDRYRAMALFRGIRGACVQLLSLVARPPLGLIPGVHPKSRTARLKRFVRSATCNTAAKRYASYLRLFDDSAIKELLGPLGRSRIANENLDAYDWVANSFGTQFPDIGCQRIDDVQAALACDRQVYLPDDLLTKVDRCSMLHALEVRSPFMDHDLVQFASTLTTAQLLGGGPKRMLREAFAADLPAWVFRRKKMGFAVPIGEWFRDSLRPMLHDHLFAANSFANSHFNIPTVRRLVEEHESERLDHSQRLYALLMLELWWKTQQH